MTVRILQGNCLDVLKTLPAESVQCVVTILTGDCREVLKTLPDASVNCCVTSPPYWGLRDYGHADQIGQESTPEEYVASLVAVFREVRRALREDGTLWLNLGDSYCSQGGSHDGREDNQPGVGAARAWRNGSGRVDGVVDERGQRNRNGNTVRNLKPKDLVGVPWRVAFALQADGWWLRSDIIWHKPNPMPESVTDRPTKSHEYIFLLTKSDRYYYDAEAIKEPVTGMAHAQRQADEQAENDLASLPLATLLPKEVLHSLTRKNRARAGQKCSPTDERNGIRPARDVGCGDKARPRKAAPNHKYNVSFDLAVTGLVPSRNKRSVWTVPTKGFAGAHFATFPEDLIRPCILAGCPMGGTVLDPFGGSGTVGLVAEAEGRNSVLIELNREYVKMAERRTAQAGLFCESVKQK